MFGRNGRSDEKNGFKAKCLTKDTHKFGNFKVLPN